MIRRIVSALTVIWFLGFLWFAIFLPQPAAPGETDAIVVPTGTGARILRGLELLRAGSSGRLLVTGVDENVRPQEFAAEYDVSPELLECCVTLGFAALDTRGNAREAAEWAKAEGVHSIRLVTSDWHMRRAALELGGALPDDVTLMRDAIHTEPTLLTLFVEYHKLLAAGLVRGIPV